MFWLLGGQKVKISDLGQSNLNIKVKSLEGRGRNEDGSRVFTNYANFRVLSNYSCRKNAVQKILHKTEKKEVKTSKSIAANHLPSTNCSLLD